MGSRYALAMILLMGLLLVGLRPSASHATAVAGSTLYIPVVHKAPEGMSCTVGSYALLSAHGGPPDRDHESHADLKLSVRGWLPSPAVALQPVWYNGSTDPAAPNLTGLFAVPRLPPFVSAFRVYEWDWGCNCRGGLVEPWQVTLLGMATIPGETIHLPNRLGGEIDGQGYKALVIYANESSITLKYTRDNNVVHGYTLHLEGLCVDPALVALYRSANGAGRAEMPALRPGQPFGRATTGTIFVAIRDNGAFMDPRSCKDWWGQQCAGAPPGELELPHETRGDGAASDPSGRR